MPTVLIVEDHDDLGELLAEALALEHWDTAVARSGGEAAHVALSVRVDVVLCDMILVEMRGLDVETLFRRHPQLAKIPFVFMTGLTAHSHHLEPTRLLLKPFTIDDALAALQRALNTLQLPPYSTG